MRVPLLLAVVLAGCVAPLPPEPAAEAPAAFDTSGPWSRTLLPGTYAALPVEALEVASFDGTPISFAVFRPATPPGVRVPVLLDYGPYYGEGDTPVGVPGARLGGFLVENYVPHGYAVVQASVRGTGASGGCADFFGPNEQRDLGVLLDALASFAWSSGAAAVLGRSYDGATAWQAAAIGHPSVRAVVPISGIANLTAMYFRNGSAEGRPLMIGPLYWTYGLTSDGRPPERVADMACPTAPQHFPHGAVALAHGSAAPVAGNDAYWRDRDLTSRLLANRDVASFVVHGLTDRNVDPFLSIPLFDALPGPKKAWFGQWGHHYPDRPEEHPHLRWDFAETLLCFLDEHVRDLPCDTGPVVEVQATDGTWRAEETFPPAARFVEFFPRADGGLGAEPGPAASVPLADPAGRLGLLDPALVATFATEPFAEPTRIVGLPQFHATFVPAGPGGHVLAELSILDAAGARTPVVHAQMDLRYADGGATPRAVRPGEPVVAYMEFFPNDLVVPAGGALELVVRQEDARVAVPAGSLPVALALGPDTVLRLPVVD